MLQFRHNYQLRLYRKNFKLLICRNMQIILQLISELVRTRKSTPLPSKAKDLRFGFGDAGDRLDLLHRFRSKLRHDLEKVAMNEPLGALKQ
jgi:hypothetical protein